MTEDEALVDRTTNIVERASALNPVIRALLRCNLDENFEMASKKLWRVKVTVTNLTESSTGIDNEVAWFPPDSATFPGHPCLSGLLTLDGTLSPASTVVGWIQIHKDVVIWLGWHGDNEIFIHWDDVTCAMNVLFGHDQNGTKWRIGLERRFVGFPPDWPPWLLD